MNNKLFRTTPIVVLAAALLGACEQLGLKAPDTALPSRLTHTCKDPNPGNIFREPDGGYHESAQGWFYKAEVKQPQSPGSASAYCYYGLDRIAPANRPVYSVHYPLTGFSAGQCSVSGRTVTCVRTAVVK